MVPDQDESITFIFKSELFADDWTQTSPWGVILSDFKIMSPSFTLPHQKMKKTSGVDTEVWCVAREALETKPGETDFSTE